MSDNFKWEDDFDVGIHEIDNQHKSIMVLVEKLCTSITDKKDKKVIDEIINELDFCFVKHFKTEEYYMEKYKFSDIKRHKEAHRFFKKTYEQIRFSYFYVDNDKNPKESILRTFSLHLCKILTDWRMVHFMTLDAEMIKFLRKNIEN